MTLVKLSEAQFSWHYDVSGSKHFHLLLLGGEISEKVTISRKFKERVVQPILKVKLNFDHRENWKGLFFLEMVDYDALVQQPTES